MSNRQTDTQTHTQTDTLHTFYTAAPIDHPCRDVLYGVEDGSGGVKDCKIMFAQLHSEMSNVYRLLSPKNQLSQEAQLMRDRASMLSVEIW